MRYYVVKLAWDTEFRFDDEKEAALFLANAARHLEADPDVQARNGGKWRGSFDFYVYDVDYSLNSEPETEEPDPEIVRPGELDLLFEEVGTDD